MTYAKQATAQVDRRAQECEDITQWARARDLHAALEFSFGRNTIKYINDGQRGYTLTLNPYYYATLLNVHGEPCAFIIASYYPHQWGSKPPCYFTLKNKRITVAQAGHLIDGGTLEKPQRVKKNKSVISLTKVKEKNPLNKATKTLIARNLLALVFFCLGVYLYQYPKETAHAGIIDILMVLWFIATGACAKIPRKTKSTK